MSMIVKKIKLKFLFMTNIKLYTYEYIYLYLYTTVERVQKIELKCTLTLTGKREIDSSGIAT